MPSLVVLLHKQDHRCWHCTHHIIRKRYQNGFPLPPNLATKDHFVPKTHGGTRHHSVAACLRCNNLRGDMDAVTFRNWLRNLFRRYPVLFQEWHEIDDEILRILQYYRIQCQAKQLESMGVHSPEYAFRHMRLLYRSGHILRA